MISYGIILGIIKLPFAIILEIVLLVSDILLGWIFRLGFKNGDDLYIDKVDTDAIGEWFKDFGKL